MYDGFPYEDPLGLSRVMAGGTASSACGVYLIVLCVAEMNGRLLCKQLAI